MWQVTGTDGLYGKSLAHKGNPTAFRRRRISTTKQEAKKKRCDSLRLWCWLILAAEISLLRTPSHEKWLANERPQGAGSHLNSFTTLSASPPAEAHTTKKLYKMKNSAAVNQPQGKQQHSPMANTSNWQTGPKKKKRETGNCVCAGWEMIVKWREQEKYKKRTE